MPTPNVQLLFGPILIGVFMNMILYGVLIVQAYTYYQTYKRDAVWIKYLVLYLLIVETINTGCDIFIIYEPLILRFGLPAATTVFPTLFASEPLVIVAVSTPIQMFFAWKIRMLTRNSWIPALIVLLSMISLAGGVWTGIMIIKLKLLAQKPELHTSALMWFLSSCIADVVITVFLVISLSRRRTGYTSTDDAISKLIQITVQTGMLTAFFAIGDVVFFMSLEHTALNFIWDIALSKLYTNCLLSTLNARASLNEIVSGQRNTVLSSAITNGRHTTFFIHNAQAMEDAVYELDSPKSFGAPSFDRRKHGSYGITVTKVVERLEDPISTPGIAQ